MAGTPQQNGVVERRNRTLLETARCLTSKQNLPPQLWAETLSTAAYLHNRLPSKATPSSTPEELYSGLKPDISHLRIFGSTAFVHIPSNKRDKLSPKTFKCILVGYDTSSKTYRCFDPTTHTIHLSRDVEVIESLASPPPTPPSSTPQPPTLEQLLPPTPITPLEPLPTPTSSPTTSTLTLPDPSSPLPLSHPPSSTSVPSSHSSPPYSYPNTSTFSPPQS